MNAGHRHVSTARPSTGSAPAPSRAGRSGSVTWMALPALVIFIAFGVIPLLGVLVLSFTSWDGIGADPLRRAHELAGRARRPRTAARALGDLPDHGPVLARADPAEHPASGSSSPATSATARSSRCSTSSRCCSARRRSPITYKALLDPNFGLGAGLHLGFLSQDWLGRTGLALGVVDLHRVLAVHPVPLADLPRRGAADPDARCTRPPQIDGAGRVRAVLLASRCRS